MPEVRNELSNSSRSRPTAHRKSNITLPCVANAQVHALQVTSFDCAILESRTQANFQPLQRVPGCAMNISTQGKNVLDACCGSRMSWFDKKNKNVLFGDIRNESHTLCDGRALEIFPDIHLDFRDMPFDDNSFKLVVFDPPHLINAGKNSWLALKYGILEKDWRTDLRKGFLECFRVLDSNGILIFKWAEVQIKTSEILELTDERPLFGHKSGKQSGTHWITFMKGAR